ncbi:MAG: 2-oxoglutarate and iron-dependent oxygenase domain-containing protein [Bacteroidota bacterium]|nr:2-oxoglutarate and iron-dependent oxygenase domain-containing protein [Bacteroidota bacterium]MEC8239084.1 2-oxoglutarate and iron-dependent oxygenase domain-containing protein [Bacteroidota bacterium]
MNQIPSFDLGDFLGNDNDKRLSFIKNLGRAYEEIGFVALKGHFLGKDLIDELYSQVRLFFSLPYETKAKYEIPGLAGQRGYTSFGKEHAKGRTTGDLKEFFHFGQNNPPTNGEDYPQNVLVDENPAFNSVGQKTFAALEKTGLFVLRALALHLGLKELYFDPYVKDGNSILRAIHYPPILEEPKKAERAAAHGDINLITLLMGAQGRGLQVQNHQGDWIDAIADEDELVINVGDMLSRHTNNKLKSTIHRVVNPPRSLWNSSRYSIPFFMHPISNMKLDVLPHCIDDENPKKFENITAGEFLEERLRDLGLRK